MLEMERVRKEYRILVAPPNSVMDTTNSMDLTSLRQALPTVTASSRPARRYSLPTHLCNQCSLHYLPYWYDYSHHRCFFCMRFRSPNITRYALLYETQWFFIQSGEDEARSYYTTYFDLLHRWADQKRIPFTQREANYQTYLLQMIEQSDPTY